MEIKYRVESIVEPEFKFNYDYDYSTLPSENVNIYIGHDIKPIMEKEQVAVKAKVTFCDKDGVELACNSIILYFGLTPIRDIFTINSDQTFSTKSSTILETFLTVAIGTLRGTCLKNLKGTALENQLIPLIPADHFKQKKKNRPTN